MHKFVQFVSVSKAGGAQRWSGGTVGCMQKGKQEIKEFKATGQEREDCRVKQGDVFTVPEAASEPRGTSVLNPSRSLIPRPGQGRGEGREGGGSRPQRTPPNLERGQTKLSILH